jgi:hypothetical protein
MATFEIESKSGEEFSIGGQITKPVTVGQPPPWPNFPSNATGYLLGFVAKRNKGDAIAVINRDSAADPSSVVLGNGGAWTVKLLAADTTDFEKTEELLFDVTLIEPNGTRTVVCEGIWAVEKSVGL